MNATAKKYVPRLPYVGDDPAKQVDVPGLGRFVAKLVGNCNYTTALDVYFHAEGREGAETGSVRFEYRIGDDHTGRWVRVRPHQQPVATDFGPEAMHQCQILADSLAARAPRDFPWVLHGAVGPDLAEYRYALKQDAETIKRLTCLLDDAAAPRDEYFPAVGTREALSFTYTAQEREERRAKWRGHIEAAGRRTAALNESARSGRLAHLLLVEARVKAWFRDSNPPCTTAHVLALAASAG